MMNDALNFKIRLWYKYHSTAQSESDLLSESDPGTVVINCDIDSTTMTGFRCPADYPYAFNEGSHCCASPFEGNYIPYLS